MKQAIAFNRNGAAYMPIKLKGLLLRHGLTQTDFAKAVKQSNGIPLSLSAVSLLLNWGTWPKATKIEDIQRQTGAWLMEKGVQTVDMDGMWDHDSDDRARCGQPSGIHVAQSMGKTFKRHGAMPPEDFDPLGEPEMLSPTAKKHFSLFLDPFREDVQGPDDVFLSPDQRYIREAMFSAAKHGGFLAVVGESGAGKTVLRKDLIDRISREGHHIMVIQPRVIDKEKLTTSNIYEAITKDLAPGATLKQSTEGKARQAEELLRDSSRAGNAHVLMIEEAHDLGVKTLKSLKRFWEIEDGFKRLLSIILIGQPELKLKLDERTNFEAREVIRRCEVAELVPLDRHLEGYLELKFKRVGKALADVFEADAFDMIRRRLIERRHGVYPLVVNNLVVKAMNTSAEIGAGKVGADVIKEI